ncbi:MAG: putative glycoside hydrolase [Patescibacteria group bacterium]|jgi:hypothetical protein
MKNLLLFSLIMLLAPAIALGQRTKGTVYGTCPWLGPHAADSLARFDFVILDMENMFNNYDSLVKIKKINPKIKLICYSNPMEIFDPRIGGRPLQNSWTDEIYAKYQSWLLKTNKGNKAIFYHGMRMMNLSSACPKINGVIYSEWMANILLTKALKDTIWDGYTMDNSGGNCAWMYSGKEKIDADNDGKPDADTTLDRTWSEGIRIFLTKIRQAKGKDFIIIGNKGSVEFSDLFDGKIFEDWPNDYLGDKRDNGWWQCMANAKKTGPYTIFQVSEKNLKFAIASAALLDNVHVAVWQNNYKFYPEFRIDFGKPIDTFRQYENAVIEVDPAKKEAKIFILKK